MNILKYILCVTPFSQNGKAKYTCATNLSQKRRQKRFVYIHTTSLQYARQFLVLTIWPLFRRSTIWSLYPLHDLYRHIHQYLNHILFSSIFFRLFFPVIIDAQFCVLEECHEVWEYCLCVGKAGFIQADLYIPRVMIQS